MRLAATVVVMLALACSSTMSIGGNRYFTDVKQLPLEKRELYLNAQKVLDEWKGDSESLVSGGYMIDSFIASEPNFLPIYIEKARHTIQTGYTGRNDAVAHNRKALTILQEVMAKDPKYAKAYVLAGHVYTNLGQYDQAAAALRTAMNLGTSDPWLYNNLGMLAVQTGRRGEARAYGEKALSLVHGNTKALVAAIELIGTHSTSNVPASAEEIAGVILANFTDPLQRLSIAARLLNSYRGNKDLLQIVSALLVMEKERSPRLAKVDALMARLILTEGYLSSSDSVEHYSRESVRAALDIMRPIADDQSVKEEVFELNIDIAFNHGHTELIKVILQRAEIDGIPERMVLVRKAQLAYYMASYDEVISIYEALVKIDPSTDDNILASAYGRLGNKDKLKSHHERLVSRHPEDAWTMGNYAWFLLFQMDDPTGAIEYGNKALKQMVYPLALTTTGLGHLFRATRHFREGRIEEAREDFQKAQSFGLSKDDVTQYCWKYCEDIQRMETALTRGDKTASSSRFNSAQIPPHHACARS